ncbi:MAG TPA: NUDIX hydrolase [Dehalococcoidia bacterium]|nr:NUDIX hydrolase [Dehalococcoidia bacterium]
MTRRRAGPRAPIERALSAGGVVYRRNETGDIEVAICGRTSDGLWGLPKGTPDPGETIEQTALREVAEETGLDVEIEREIGAIDYWFVSAGGVRVHKTVRHFLMRAIGGSIDRHDHEYDEVRWVPIDEAIGKMTHQNEADILRKVADTLRARTL